jgi:hypothetical protein
MENRTVRRFCAPRGSGLRPALAEATATFQRLGAVPWLARARAAGSEIAA